MDSAKIEKEEGRGKGKERGSNLWFPVLLITLCIIVEYLSGMSLPQQGNLTRNAPLPDTETFSVVNSRKNLVELTQFGPRVTGARVTELEIPKYLKNKVKEIVKDVPSSVKIEIDQQNPASNFYLDFLGGLTNVYKNVTNVVVRVSWPDEAATSSSEKDATEPFNDDYAVLINAHFDSVPGSPGAGDDGVGIACMMEVLRILAHGPRLKHPIILLFNGAEEGNHQAAHGFITQHRWAPQVKYVFNLEAIGTGGQEMMFQCNSGWLAAFYGRMAPHPHAAVMAHELFKHLLHRMASTDWSTLLKYGSPGIRGLDTAYIQNGYVYHTSFDTAEIVPNGTLVNTGENILYLTKALASSSEVPHFTTADPTDELAVFFDFMGVVFIVYSGVNVTIIHSLVVVLCLGVVYALSRSVSNFSTAKLRAILAAECYCYLVPILVGALYGVVVYFVCPMRWYNGGIGLCALIYSPPVLLAIFYTRGQTSETVLNTPQIRILSGLLFPWLFWLVPGIFFGIMSVYACCLWIVSTAFAVCVHAVARYYTLRHAQPPTKYLFSPDFFYLLAQTPMIILWAQVTRSFLTMTVPLLGKSGTVVPTDPAVGALMGALLSGPLPLIFAFNLERPVLTKTTTRASVGVIVTILLVCTVFLTPYSAERPKRLWIQHLHRSFVTHSAISATPTVRTDCGLWISAFDEQGMTPLQSIGVGRLDGRHKASTSCDVWSGDCYMKFPWYFPVSEVLRDAHYIPTECPAGILPIHELRLSLSSVGVGVDHANIDNNHKEPLRLVRVALHGPNHMHLVVRDNAQGKRIHRWYIPAATLDPSSPAGTGVSTGSTAATATETNEAVHVKMAFASADGRLERAKIIHTPAAVEVATSSPENDAVPRPNGEPPASVHATLKMVTPPVVRAEGVHFLSIGFGLCSEVHGCQQDLYLLVRGDAPIEIAAYGHYTDQTEDTAELKALLTDLPQWSKGAEWTKFPSLLVQDSV